MRHVWTTRLVLITAALLVASAALFAWAQNAPGRDAGRALEGPTP